MAHVDRVEAVTAKLTEAEKRIEELRELLIAIKTIRGLGYVIAGVIAAAGVIYGMWRR